MQNHISHGTGSLLLSAEPRGMFYLSIDVRAAEELFCYSGQGAKYCDQCICVSVSLYVHIAQKLHVQTSQNCLHIRLHVTCSHGSVLL